MAETVVKIERLTSRIDRRNGNTHEAFAPEGYRFVDGCHSLICSSEAEALATSQFAQIEPCPADCDCKEE